MSNFTWTLLELEKNFNHDRMQFIYNAKSYYGSLNSERAILTPNNMIYKPIKFNIGDDYRIVINELYNKE
jgi:hypothetical protein